MMMLMKYIYYDELCVCLSVTKNDHFRTEHQRCKARRPFWPGDDDDDVDDYGDDEDDVDGDDDDVDEDDVDDDKGGLVGQVRSAVSLVMASWQPPPPQAGFMSGRERA